SQALPLEFRPCQADDQGALLYRLGGVVELRDGSTPCLDEAHLDVLGGRTLRHLGREVGIELCNISNGGWMAPTDPNGVLLRQHRGGSPGSQQRGGKNEADS